MQTNRSATWISVLGLAVSLAALWLAVSAVRHPGRWTDDLGRSDPKEAAFALYKMEVEGPWIHASHAFANLHRDELLRTLTASRVEERGDYALVYLEYSAGGRPARDARWFARVGGKWYFWQSWSPRHPEDAAPGLDWEWYSEQESDRVVWIDDEAKRPAYR